MSVEVKNLNKRFADSSIFNDLNVTFRPDTFSVLLGPSGSGKSVLFRILNGLETQDSGNVFLNGTEISGLSAPQRNIGYVPQSFALFPHFSVAQNIAYPMNLAKRPRDEVGKKVSWAADILSIRHLLDKTPDQLSGGEKQRTAVARGLVTEARVYVLDDPLVGLDYKLRERLMAELKEIQRELDATFIYATSDPLEALNMSQDIHIMDNGRIIQSGDVFDVYTNPQTTKVMELTGFPKANILSLDWFGKEAKAGPFAMESVPQGAGYIGIRPEHLIIGETSCNRPDASAIVTLVEDLGGDRIVYLNADGSELTTAIPGWNDTVLREGDEIKLSLDRENHSFFDTTEGNVINFRGSE